MYGVLRQRSKEELMQEAVNNSGQALAFIEIGGWSPAMVVLDAMEKNASVSVVQTELNDAPGVCIKLSGSIADINAAARSAEESARAMQTAVLAHVIARPSEGSRAAWQAEPDFNPLIEQPSVQRPEKRMNDQASFAVGLIETQGFTAAFEAIDTALKTANVEVLAREKLGGGYITIVIKGDVAAVRAAVDAGKARVEGLGKLIAAHVIPSPSKGVLSLLPK
jgi:microcompartment protein CcmL/EutN